jgi:uncharacterized protein DUF4154
MTLMTQFTRSLRRASLAALLGIAAGAVGWPAGSAWSQDDPVTLEHRVKAAFLYKFAGYVDWPTASFARPDTPVTIAVLGAEPVAEELVQAVAGRTVDGRPVMVKRLKPGESLAGVHILFIGKAESARLGQLAQTAQPRAILTVTESDGALAQGSIINFVMADRRVRFEISLDAAEKSGLKLSSRLLAVAQQVRTGTP